MNYVKSNIFGAVTLVLISISIYMVFLYAPTEITMGDVQRIFYFHVPNGMVGFLAFAVTCVGSVMFLIKKDFKWDRLASSSAELGFLFITANLISGILWAKPAWGIWWTWDARLTSLLVLWLIFLTYMMLRGYIDESNKKAYISSVVGIIGFLNVPLVYFSIWWWRTQHPSPVLFGGGEDSGLEPPMRLTFNVCIITFIIFYFYLLNKKLNLEKSKEEVEYLYKMADNT